MRTIEEEKPKVQRPWGGYTVIKKGRYYWVKKLFVNKDARLSLQSHQSRDELWIVLSGSIIAEIGHQKITAHQGSQVFVPKEEKHRLVGLSDACVLEVAFGRVREKDITRYEDDYGRADYSLIES